MNKKFTSTVAGASLFLAAIGLLGRGIGFIREIIFASYFGLSEEFDIYLVGAVLPLTLDIIIFYVGQNFLIPLFHSISENSPDQKVKILRSNFWLFTFCGIFLAAILYLLSNQFIDFYLGDASEEVKNKATIIFNIFIATIPYTASISMLTAYLQSEFNFSSPGISKLFLNISVVILVLLFTNHLDIYVIPIGYLVGTIFQFIYLLIKSRIKLFGELSLKESYVSLLKGSLIFIVLIEAISQLYILSDRFFIGAVDPGGIAGLNYAQILFLLPISIVTLALSTAILPKLSKSFSAGSYDELQQSYDDGIKINLSMFVPLTFIFFFYGDDLIRIIYQRGNFTEEDTVTTYNALKYFSLSFVFLSTYSISNKLMYSAKLIKTLLLITVIGISIKILFNFILVDSMKQDGLAASTSLSYLFFFLSTSIVLSLKDLIKKIIFAQELIFNLVCGLVAFLIVDYLSDLFTLYFKDYLEIIFFLFIYFVTLLLIKSRSTQLIISMFYRLLGKAY